MHSPYNTNIAPLAFPIILTSEHENCCYCSHQPESAPLLSLSSKSNANFPQRVIIFFINIFSNNFKQQFTYICSSQKHYNYKKTQSFDTIYSGHIYQFLYSTNNLVKFAFQISLQMGSHKLIQFCQDFLLSCTPLSHFRLFTLSTVRESRVTIALHF